jgi:chemotaxis protein methyltransferase CheR
VSAGGESLLEVADAELEELLQALFERYHYDFRSYAPSSLRRRVGTALERMGCESVARLQQRVIDDPRVFAALLDIITVQLSELFRDPAYFLAVRERVVPLLRTYPSIKLWVAGCSTGEEVYSFLILLHEEQLLDRTLVYATDISLRSLQKAEAGIYDISRLAQFSENHRRAGGRSSLSDYYTAAYGKAIFAKWLRRNVVFADHSLATDNVFSEVHLVSCRNVLIYFDRHLQDRALGLFQETLCRKGFLGLGAKETPRFSRHSAEFSDFDAPMRLYQKRN